MEQHITLIIVSIIVVGMSAQWLAWRFKLPAIVLLTVSGLLAGPVLGWMNPSRDLGELLAPIIKLGVAVILFEGGLSLRFHEFRQAATGVTRLVTLAVALSFPLGAAAAHYIGGLSWPVAWVFGAIIVVTGPTVIIPLLRQARLRRRAASYLKWEAIINDPTGALLAVVIFEYLTIEGGITLPEMAQRLGLGLAIAAALGVGAAYLLGLGFRRGLVPEYLKGPLALAGALAVYVLANYELSEAGLLAATLFGVTLGNMRLPSIDEMRRFKEYIALLLVSTVFILLTADLQPGILLELNWRSLALLLTVLFVLRPLSIFTATIGAKMTWQERTLLAWIAPRGIVAAAVAGVFGPALTEQGFAGAQLLLPLVFALILITVLAHGLSIGWLSRRLDLSATGSHGVLMVGANPWSTGLAQALMDKKIPVMVVDSSWHRLRMARLAGVKTFYGEILAEASEQRLEFNDYGLLFAATDNDAYNALVCSHFGAEMGRTHVYQLPDVTLEEKDPKRLPLTRRGLITPAERAWYEELHANWYRGWTFQKTQLSENFDYKACIAALPVDSLPILAIKEDGTVQFNSPEHDINPKPGDVIIWFGPKAEKLATVRAAKESPLPAGEGKGESESKSSIPAADLR